MNIQASMRRSPAILRLAAVDEGMSALFSGRLLNFKVALAQLCLSSPAWLPCKVLPHLVLLYI